MVDPAVKHCFVSTIGSPSPDDNNNNNNNNNDPMCLLQQLELPLTQEEKRNKQIYDEKLIHAQALDLLILLCKEISKLNDKQLDDGRIEKAIFKAVKNGIVEFITEIIKAMPDLLRKRDSNRRDVFMSAIENRQEIIFNLIYGIGARMESRISCTDKFRCNMLHLAGKLAPPSQLAQISGAALQMQRELQWFKELESIISPLYKKRKNKENETPSQVFTRNHKDLVKEGEKWMKGTATSYTVVGALIMTIMFAAAFTVPGGNDQITGFPIFLQEKWFMAFIISDAVSLFSSSTSVLMFLGILTSRYKEDDFLESLPKKLIIGLLTLFVSVAAMMIAFSAALLIMLKGRLQIAIPIVSLASIPVALFLLLQFPLLVEIFISTYGPSIFDRKMKRWL